MSDLEEPPSKMSRYTDLQYLDESEDGLDDGQEEWLSDGVLTEDEYPASGNVQVELKTETTSQEGDIDAQKGDNEARDCNIEAHEGDIEAQVHMEPTPAIKAEMVESKTDFKNTEQNIELSLNSFDALKSGNGVTEDLNTFLIRKSDGQVLDAKVKDEAAAVVPDAQEVIKDDGNDTDDLLRMLGEDNVRLKKKTIKIVKSEKNEEASSDDDDEYIFERSKMKTLRLAKSGLMNKPATRAEPEAMSDDTDASTDEASTVKRMFGVNRTRAAAALRPRRRLVRLNTAAKRSETPESPKQIKQHANKNIQPKSILKTSTPIGKTKVESQPASTLKSVEIKTPTPFKPLEKQTQKSTKVSKSDEKDASFKSELFDDIIDEEFLDDDGLDVESFGSESEEEGIRQHIRRPERMDEEAPSDGDSHTEDGSLYDELPSSDSDDMDDWFSLDIRAERAGDYLPLLGGKARALLVSERGRVESRVGALRQSLAALTASARRQADQLRAAAMALAEIDDTLRAA